MGKGGVGDGEGTGGGNRLCESLEEPQAEVKGRMLVLCAWS